MVQRFFRRRNLVRSPCVWQVYLSGLVSKNLLLGPRHMAGNSNRKLAILPSFLLPA